MADPRGEKRRRSVVLIAAVLIGGRAFAADPFELTGVPPGVTPLKTPLPMDFPAPLTTEGKPVESRSPELPTDKPAFSGQTRAPYHATVKVTVTTITDKLKQPWSLAFLPGGKMLVTEKPGSMRIVDASGAVSEPVKNVPAVHFGGVAGLLDVALDPAFATNHRIFFSYSEDVADNKSNTALARATLDEGAGALNDVKVIFRALPALPVTVGGNQAAKIAVAKDGTLYMTVGDRSRSPPWDVAQRLDTHLGKVIHITADGAPAAGNPFIGKPGALPEIWSYGHRNEMGLAFAPDGKLWEHENGPKGGDELNLVAAGKNYGWPIITHGVDYPGEQIDNGLTAKQGMEQPRYYWDPVIAASGLAVYEGNLFPQWRGNLLVGALRGTQVDRLALSGDKVVNEEPVFFDPKSRVRDVRVGPEGAVYALTDDGRLLKLTPK